MMPTKDQRGLSNSVMATLIFPLVLSVLFLAMQWAMVAWGTAVAQGAAQDAARAAAAFDATADAGHSAATSAITTDALHDVNVDVTRGPALTSATITGQALQVIPGFPTNIEVTATAPTERLTTP